MINYTWEIIKIFSKEDLITEIKYKLIGNNQIITIETEGTYLFNDPVLNVPFLEVTEEMVIDWIEADAVIDGKNHIKMGIEKQVEALKSHKPVPAPWLPQVFKPEI